MRINQYIAATTGLSRRAADAAIAAGQVMLNGQTATLGQTVALGDQLQLNGRPLQPPSTHHYILLHKPAGYISSHSQQGTSPTLYQLLPPAFQDLRIAGRLDRDSSGLILLSDDGPFIQRHTHPSYGKQKIYHLTLARPLAPADLQHLETGVKLADGPSRVNIIENRSNQVTVGLSEGRNRQLRRTFGALGYTIERLHRTTIGPYRIGNLKPGQWAETSSHQP